MELWETILTTALTCLATLIVTNLFNYIINKPKKKKEEEQKKQEELKQEIAQLNTKIDTVETHMMERIDELKQDRTAEHSKCREEHKTVVDSIEKVRKETTEQFKAVRKENAEQNEKQNVGLQSVLKDLLKIRYVAWIEKGYAPMDAREDLEHMYQAYHDLKGNGTITELREKFMKLPLKPEEK